MYNNYEEGSSDDDSESEVQILEDDEIELIPDSPSLSPASPNYIPTPSPPNSPPLHPLLNADDQDNEDDDDNDENLKPPRKQLKLDTEESGNGEGNKSLNDDSDGYTCTICYEPFTNSGDHRISCLKCGHVFGKNCIDRWLNQKHGRCPQCNAKATKKDVRILFVKSLKAIDNTEVTEVKRELERVQNTNAAYALESAKMKIKIECLEQQIQRLEEQKARNSSSSAGASNSLDGSQSALSGTLINLPAGRKVLKFLFSRFFDFNVCRVGAYNESMNMLVVSHEMKSPLFPNGCSGIRKISMLEERMSMSLPIHQKQIRDMSFSLCQNDVLLTAAMDKKALLFNSSGNVTVQTFQTDSPLWSCVWDEIKQYLFYVGTANGQIITYDIRSPTQPLCTFSMPAQDSSPVCRLKFVNHTYQSNAFNLSGLLVQKLNSVWFCEFRGGRDNEQRFHQLPLDGPFVNIDFEPRSRHMLVSTRPSLRAGGSSFNSHLLCDLTQYYCETQERNVVSSNLIRTYQGGNREVQKISRASIFSPEEGYVYACANGQSNTVKLWDISQAETNYGTIGPAPELTLDFVHGKVNNTDFMGLVSEKGVRIFKQSFGT